MCGVGLPLPVVFLQVAEQSHFLKHPWHVQMLSLGVPALLQITQAALSSLGFFFYNFRLQTIKQVATDIGK